MILCVSKINVNKAWIHPKNTRGARQKKWCITKALMCEESLLKMSPPFQPSVYYAGVSSWSPLASTKHLLYIHFKWTNEFVLKSHRIWSMNDQSVVCEGSLLKTSPPFKSSVSEVVRFVSVIIVSRYYSWGWLSRVCNVHRFVHFNPLLMHWHCWILYLRLHLHDNSCSTVSGTGDPRLPSQWSGHHHSDSSLTGLGIVDVVGDCISRCQAGS